MSRKIIFKPKQNFQNALWSASKTEQQRLISLGKDVMARLGEKLLKEFKNELPRMNSNEMHTYRDCWNIFLINPMNFTRINNFNRISNACCESIFSQFRRKEKENYHFSSLMVRSVAVFNKTINWLKNHPKKSSFISQALRFVKIFFLT